MTTFSDRAVAAGELPDRLVDRLVATKVTRIAGVEAVFERILRHLFLPCVPLAQAYADGSVSTKADTAASGWSPC